MASAQSASLNLRRVAAIAVRLVAIFAIVAVTNVGIVDRINVLVAGARWGTLVGFIGVWAVALVALVIAAFQRNPIVRWFWAALIAASTAAGFLFYRISGTEISLYDAVSLWNVRHETGRAADFYQGDLARVGAVLLAVFVLMAIGPVVRGPRIARFFGRLAWAPLVPIALFAGIVIGKEGGGSLGLPTQFSPLSIGALTIVKAATNPLPERNAVTWRPGAPRARHVVLLVDESVRGDYIDWTSGNPNTPALAAMRDRFVDFGPAVSGGNCSHYSNAILRFDGAREDLVRTMTTNPTLWQYAKAAGYRTVFIDAQAGFIKSAGKLQNFMTPDEAKHIDNFNAADAATPAPELDDRLIDTLVKALKSDQPVFAYAVKNGAHFPYDRSYPESERRLRPVMTDAASDDVAARINSYRNVIRWSVDRILKRLMDEVDLKDTVIVYTSDHGQNLTPTRLTHCTVEEPDPREGLVPLFVATGDAGLRARFAAGARDNKGRASHFAIAPTLLQLFGYDAATVGKTYGASLLEKSAQEPAFTTGDVFGMFSSKVRWHPLDLSKSYLEQPARPIASRRTDPNGEAAPD